MTDQSSENAQASSDQAAKDASPATSPTKKKTVNRPQAGKDTVDGAEKPASAGKPRTSTPKKTAPKAAGAGKETQSAKTTAAKSRAKAAAGTAEKASSGSRAKTANSTAKNRAKTAAKSPAPANSTSAAKTAATESAETAPKAKTPESAKKAPAKRSAKTPTGKPAPSADPQPEKAAAPQAAQAKPASKKAPSKKSAPAKKAPAKREASDTAAPSTATAPATVQTTNDSPAQAGQVSKPSAAVPAVKANQTGPAAQPISDAPAFPSATAAAAQPNAYGQVKPLQKKRSRKGAIAAMAVIAAVVIAAIIAAPRIIDAMSPAQMLPSTSGPVTVLTTQRVSDDLENMGIPAPNLGDYSYILTDDLIGPRFSIPDIEDMMQTVSGDKPSYSQKITTKATYNNKGIRIVVPISVMYTYDEAGQTWTHDEPVLGTPETEPLSAASYEAVLEDIDLILRSYEDESFKALFKGAEITGQTPSLTKDGGTIAVNIFSQTETQTASAAATISLTWDEAKGWVATIAETTTPEVVERDLKQELLDKEQEEADQAEEEAYANETKPQYHIECTNADVVEFNGKMSRSGSGYPLTLNDPLRLTLDGELCYVHTIALTFGEYEDYAVYKPEDIDPEALVGSNQGFAGTLSYTDAGSQAVSFANSKNRDHAYETEGPLVAMRVIEA